MISKLYRIRDDICFHKQYIRIMRICNSGVAEGQITVFNTVVKVSLIDRVRVKQRFDGEGEGVKKGVPEEKEFRGGTSQGEGPEDQGYLVA